ncbi:recombinase family protein [Streptomyces hyaluromycini]|uniref:recombinase family protein n=1 Tax=Streptomyces hyaluromycini TaxID=1377993 RepID=UPI001237C513|nr:recombinase family protein [Streptomyces hyaluromycini]
MVVQAGLDRPAELVLDESGIEDPVIFEEDGATSRRLYPLQRPKFRELLTYARPGDTMHISEMGRLVRGTGHILDVLHRDQMALRIHDGAFSQMDLTARHPRTDELMYDGLRAAEAEGGAPGRRRSCGPRAGSSPAQGPGGRRDPLAPAPATRRLEVRSHPAGLEERAWGLSAPVIRCVVSRSPSTTRLPLR